MSKLNAIKTIFLIFLLLFPAVIGQAQEITGEIINVNYEYKIAFTDLTNDYLNPNDIVGVYKDGQFLTYLEVSQSTPAISRLVPVESYPDTKYRTDIEFSQITVGNTVSKIDDLKGLKAAFRPSTGTKISSTSAVSQNNPGATQPIQTNVGSLEKKVRVLSDNYVRLSTSLSELLAEKRGVETENLELKKQIEGLLVEIKDLKTTNNAIESQNNNLHQMQANNNCADSKKKIDALTQALSVLKNKLINMKNLLKKE